MLNKVKKKSYCLSSVHNQDVPATLAYLQNLPLGKSCIVLN